MMHNQSLLPDKGSTPFRVVYLRQAKEVVLIRVWRSERPLELPANAT